MGICAELEDFGFEVLEAANAAQAIDLLNANPEIRVMFTDVDMPGGADGLMLAASVRDRWPPIQIIVTSGHRGVSSEDLPDGSCFFDMPYRHEAIASAMREMIG